MSVDLRRWVPVGGRERPLVTEINGKLMARRSWHYLHRSPCPTTPPSSSTAAIPRAGAWRVKAREATASRLGLDRADPAETIDQRGGLPYRLRKLRICSRSRLFVGHVK
jgi:hypothetical protein